MQTHVCLSVFLPSFMGAMSRGLRIHADKQQN